MGYELLYLPPADEAPTKADISQGFIIRWTLMNKNGVLQEPFHVTAIDQNIVRAGPASDPVPLVLNEGRIWRAIHDNPTMGSVWVISGEVLIDHGSKVVDHEEEMSLIFTIGYACPENGEVPQTFYSASDWNKVPARVQKSQCLHVLDSVRETNSQLLEQGDRRRQEAKVNDDARGELVGELQRRMDRLKELGGDIKGLPDYWNQILSPDEISQMLDEVERVYRPLLIDKIRMRGGNVNTDSDASIDLLEQLLKGVIVS
ncbi:hypothetical protein BJX66DRAFT_303020 [Aspergillus keveii]|uniref:Uncharacterized protein n=1 Tax=Aspergillus keveii TaxID=714993 RepID=A0ABR4G7B5_9EURO